MQSSLNKAPLRPRWLPKIMDVIARLPGCDGQAVDAVSAHTRVNLEVAPRLLKISQIGTSRCLDTSSTTHIAQIMGQQWRSRGTSRTKLVWSSISPIEIGQTVRTSFIRTSMRETSALGMYVLRTQSLFLSVYVEWHLNGWKEAAYGSYVEEIETCGHWRTYIISWPRVLGMHSMGMQTKWNNHEQYTKMFESRIFAGATEKLPGWDKPHAQTVAWSYDMEGHAQ